MKELFQNFLGDRVRFFDVFMQDIMQDIIFVQMFCSRRFSLFFWNWVRVRRGQEVKSRFVCFINSVCFWVSYFISVCVFKTQGWRLFSNFLSVSIIYDIEIYSSDQVGRIKFVGGIVRVVDYREVVGGRKFICLQLYVSCLVVVVTQCINVYREEESGYMGKGKGRDSRNGMFVLKVFLDLNLKVNLIFFLQIFKVFFQLLNKYV